MDETADWCLVNELAGDLLMKLLLYQLPILPAGCTTCRARGCNHQFTNAFPLSPFLLSSPLPLLSCLQARLDAVASQPPITRLAHVLTAAFGCDLVAGQSDGSNDDDGLASGQQQHQQPCNPCPALPPWHALPLMPSKRFVRYSAQNCWAFHAIIAVPHTHTAKRKPTPSPISTPWRSLHAQQIFTRFSRRAEKRLPNCELYLRGFYSSFHFLSVVRGKHPCRS